MGVAFAGAMILLGSDDKGWIVLDHMVPFAGIFLAIIGFTAGATWVADLTDASKR